MLRYYQFRWVYASVSGLLLFVVCVYYYLYPQCGQLVFAKKTESQLQNELAAWRQRYPSELAQIKALPLPEGDNAPGPSNTLIALLRGHWLSIQSMEVMSTRKNLGGTEVQLIAQGTFPQWSAFLSSLENSKNFFIENFSIKTGAPLTIAMKIKLLPKFITHADDKVKLGPAVERVYNPFCVTNSEFNDDYPIKPSLNSIPLQQLKMVGFMQYGQSKQAVLTSPDHLLWVVSPGALIGNEQAKTIAITEHYLEAQLIDGKFWRITM